MHTGSIRVDGDGRYAQLEECTRGSGRENARQVRASFARNVRQQEITSYCLTCKRQGSTGGDKISDYSSRMGCEAALSRVLPCRCRRQWAIYSSPSPNKANEFFRVGFGFSSALGSAILVLAILAVTLSMSFFAEFEGGGALLGI